MPDYSQLMLIATGMALFLALNCYSIRSYYSRLRGKNAERDPVYRVYAVFPLLAASIGAQAIVISHGGGEIGFDPYFKGISSIYSTDANSLGTGYGADFLQVLCFGVGISMFPFLVVEFAATRQKRPIGITKHYEERIAASRIFGYIPRVAEVVSNRSKLKRIGILMRCVYSIFSLFTNLSSWLWKYLLVTMSGFYIWRTLVDLEEDVKLWQFALDIVAAFAAYSFVLNIVVYFGVKCGWIDLSDFGWWLERFFVFYAIASIVGMGICWLGPKERERVTHLQFLILTVILLAWWYCLISTFSLPHAPTVTEDSFVQYRLLLVILIVSVFYLSLIFIRDTIDWLVEQEQSRPEKGHWDETFASMLRHNISSLKHRVAAAGSLSDRYVHSVDQLTFVFNDMHKDLEEMQETATAVFSRKSFHDSGPQFLLSELVSEIIDSSKAYNPQINIAHNIPRSVVLTVNRYGLRVALRYMIQNACEELSNLTENDEKLVHIRWFDSQELARIGVVDSGRGFNLEDVLKSSNTPSSTKGPERGRGLKIAKSIAVHWKGDIGRSEHFEEGAERNMVYISLHKEYLQTV